MKTNKRALYEVLRNMNKIVSPKASLDILTTVKISSNNDTLTITGTDVNNTLTAELPCSGVDISICINAKQLQQIIKPEGKADNSDVTLYQEEEMLVIECLGVKTKIPIMDPDDFPYPEEKQWNLLAIWPAKKLLDALKFTSMAACTDETRPHICSVCLIEDAVVATNGHALHKCTSPAPLSTPLLLRLDTVNLLLNLLKLTDNVIIVHSDGQVKTKVGVFVLQSKLVNDQFLPYDQVIPKTQSTMVKIETTGFLKALKRVLRLSGSSGVKMTVNGSMELAVDNELGSVAVDIPLKESIHSDELFVAGFNPVYLLSAIPQDAQEVILTMDGPLDPLVVEDKDKNRKAVVMPMRI